MPGAVLARIDAMFSISVTRRLLCGETTDPDDLLLDYWKAMPCVSHQPDELHRLHQPETSTYRSHHGFATASREMTYAEFLAFNEGCSPRSVRRFESLSSATMQYARSSPR